MMRAVRAILDGTDALEPNNAHATTVGRILLRAIQRAEDEGS